MSRIKRGIVDLSPAPIPLARAEAHPAAARRAGSTSDAVALAWLLHHPWVDVVLSGAATVEQLHSNLAAAGIEWSPDLDEELDGLGEASEPYWATRSDLDWT